MPDDTAADPHQIIAELRRELAQCRADLAEARDQQTAAAEVLQVINSSPGDLAPVFDAMLENAMRLCEASFGLLTSFDGEAFHAAALRAVPAGFAASWREPRRPGPGLALYRLMQGENFVHVPDVTMEDAYRTGDPIRRALADLGGARTGLWVALRKDAALLGAFVIYRQEVRPFTDKHIALLENFAAQAVIAMENARLITETREALEQQTATAEVLAVINSSPGDLAPVFDAILEKAHTLCGAISGSLQVYDGDQFRALACRGLTAPVVNNLRQGFRPSADHPMSRLFDGARFVQIPDMAQVEDPGARAGFELGGMRTMLSVPLRKDGSLLGQIVAVRPEVRPFADKEIALLENFAAQAVIAMENARLITETREALDQQTATAEVLGVINSSPGDLAPVFEVMLQKALRLCEGTFGNLLSYDGEFFRIAAATHGDGRVAERLLQRPPFAVDATDNALCPVLRGDDLVFVADVRELYGYRTEPIFQEMVDSGGYRSLLNVALRRDGILLGVIGIFRDEVRPFSDKQIALLQNFAAQAVIAMENARLITETREALEQQTATAEVLQVINSSPGDLAPVFGAMLEKALRLCDAAFGALSIVEGNTLQLRAHRNVPQEFADYIQHEVAEIRPETMIGRAILTRSVVQLPDILEGEPFRRGAPFAIAAAELGGIRTMLWVPLVRDNVALGVFTIYRQEVHPFSDKQIALLQNFAAQAVIAMENARLITETREALEQQTATAEVLGVINSSPGDLAPVFDAILEKAHTLCRADMGSLQLYDGEMYRAVAIRGAVLSVAEQLRRPRRPDPKFPIHRLFAGEPFVHVPDLAEVDATRTGYLVKVAGLRTVLYVALRKEETLLGFIGAGRSEVRPFTDKQIALLQNFAAQAVIAMENARLLGELRERTEEIAGWNKELEARVAAQLAELEQTGKLRRFLAPQLADLIVAQGNEAILESHRREIVVVFCDLRGFTAFAERAEPEEVMALLKEYHATLGPIVASFEGTLDHYSGDGIMVFFNDPLPTPEPARRAVEMALAMREAAQGLLRNWRRHGHDLGFGVGISQGYATLGQIGFAERMDYTAIGTVTNLAARLCAEARDGQILVSARVATAVEGSATLEEIGDLALKGLSQAVAVFNVVQ
jgi:GAF domain-containing protein